MKIHKMEQRTADWYNIRLGRFTGSNFSIFMTENETKTKNNELDKKASERITQTFCDSDFKNIHIDRGVRLEDEARLIYEMETGNNVEQVGFITLGDYVGCSPDGLIGDDGLIEIKCKDNHTFFRTKIDNNINKEHFIQIQFQLLVSKRIWCDYVVYNPNFQKSIIIKRIYICEETIKEIKKYLKLNIKYLKLNINRFKEVLLCKKNKQRITKQPK